MLALWVNTREREISVCGRRDGQIEQGGGGKELKDRQVEENNENKEKKRSLL